jgi:hypothetical protein
LSRCEQPRPDEAMPHYRADDAQWSRPCKGQCEHHKQIRDDQARIHNERGIPTHQADTSAGGPQSSSPSPRPIANADRTSHLCPSRLIAASSLRSGHRVLPRKYNRDGRQFWIASSFDWAPFGPGVRLDCVWMRVVFRAAKEPDDRRSRGTRAGCPRGTRRGAGLG